MPLSEEENGLFDEFLEGNAITTRLIIYKRHPGYHGVH